jgi:hypothetical protein
MRGAYMKESRKLGGLFPKVIDSNYPFVDGSVSDDVLLEDAFEALGSHCSVPRSFRIDHEPWPTGANSEAGGLCAHYRNAGFLHPTLDYLPQGFPLSKIATVRADADEEMLASG